MTRESAGDPEFVLRTQVMPALRAYGIDNVEVAYTIGATRVVEAMQFRDARGLRIPRGIIPEGIARCLESCVKSFLVTPNLGYGAGVVTACLSTGRLVRHHQRFDADESEECQQQ